MSALHIYTKCPYCSLHVGSLTICVIEQWDLSIHPLSSLSISVYLSVYLSLCLSPFSPSVSLLPPQVPLGDTECSEVEHRVSEGLLHRGQHMHGALPITGGQRWGLIVWMRASRQRNRCCPMCSRLPALLPAPGFADGFTDDVRDQVGAHKSCVLTWCYNVSTMLLKQDTSSMWANPMLC